MTDFDAILKELSLPEKCLLLSGASFTSTRGLPKHGLRAIKCSDALTDVRGSTILANAPAAAIFPNATALASTWDVDQIFRIGEAITKEMEIKGVELLLAPNCNLTRDPRAGRNQETFGEDPVLSGKAAAAFLNGIQSKGYHGCIKHIVCNDAETSRREYDVVVDEKTLRELYLRPFEIAVDEANPSSLMTAYNSINGSFASEQKRILTDIVRGEWKYDGLFISDWFGTYDGIKSLEAGCDLEMPFPVTRAGKLIGAVSSGAISEKVVDDAVKRMMHFLKRINAPAAETRKPEKASQRSDEQAAVLRQTVADSILLLKNDNAALPINIEKTKSVAVIGSYSEDRVIPHLCAPSYIVTPLQGIQDALQDSSCEVLHCHGPQTHKLAPILDHRYTSNITYNAYNNDASGNRVGESLSTQHFAEALQAYISGKPEGLGEDYEIELTADIAIPASQTYTFGVISTSHAKVWLDGKEVYTFVPDGLVDAQRFLFMQHTFEQQFDIDLEQRTYKLKVVTKSQKPIGGEPVAQGLIVGLVEKADAATRIKEAVDVAKKADKAIVFIGTGAEWEMEGLDREDIKLPAGQEELLKALIEARRGDLVVVNQSGAAVDLNIAQGASAIVHAHYGGTEVGSAIADVLFGQSNPSGKACYTWPKQLADSPTYGNFPHDKDLKMHYSEGMRMGWRGYESKDGRSTKALYPFGYGLSYTTFQLSDASISGSLTSDSSVSVSVKVTNTGKVAGREVVQVYIKGEEKLKTLEGFRKTKSIAPGESETVELRFSRRAFSAWDEQENGWKVEKGHYALLIGNSSIDLPIAERVEVQEGFVWKGLV